MFFMARSKYKAPPRVKVGKCWYVAGYNGKPMVGLSWDKGNGYYFPTHFKKTKEYDKTKKRPTFGKDYDTAIRLFIQWQNRHHEDYYNFPRRAVHEGLEHKNVKPTDMKYRGKTIYTSESVKGVYKIPESLIVQKAKELFAKYPPSVVADKFGMPSLAKIDYVDDLVEPYTLQDVADAYFKKKEFSQLTKEQEREQKKVRKSWDRLCKAVDAKNIKELTKTELKKFYRNIYAEFRKKDRSTSWLKGYCERVKRVVNVAIDELDNEEELVKAKIRFASVLKAPRAEVKEPPQRIPKDIFIKILEASTEEEKCMWLISMNLAYYTVDVANLPLSAIDFDNGTVVFRRGKTGNHRSGVMWDITIDSIRESQSAVPHKGETLFLNMQDKVPYSQFDN